MRKALSVTGRAIGFTGKLVVTGIILAVSFVMNCIGALIGAVTD